MNQPRSYVRQDVTFMSEGTSCAAWLYRPEGAENPPIVVPESVKPPISVPLSVKPPACVAPSSKSCPMLICFRPPLAHSTPSQEDFPCLYLRLLRP